MKHTEETKNKIRIKATGRLHSKETKEHLSKIMSGENRKKLKLSWVKVANIREMLKNGLSAGKIAKFFSVSKTLITQIKLNKKWKI